jgi:hypothetical protein
LDLVAGALRVESDNLGNGFLPILTLISTATYYLIEKPFIDIGRSDALRRLQ